MNTAPPSHPVAGPGPRPPAVGIIYPDHAAEDEYPAAAQRLGVRLPVEHVYGTDLHAVAELMDLGSPERLADGVRRLMAREGPGGLDAVMWACTSGSFVFGHEGVRRQAEQLAEVAGVPAASTSQAFVAALTALGIDRVAVAASYPADVSRLFSDYLQASGIRVQALGSAGIETAAGVGRLTAEQVTDLALRNDDEAAGALLIPDTAMHTLGVVGDVETRLGKPVLTANQVTLWYGLQLAGSAGVTSPGWGTLFTGTGTSTSTDTGSG
ncbi:maleate cis-trans isomerase [Citricoccus sp. NPDC055426]|uniref:maleate cis-trans isomerase family protein n=1 Tax=Citricoccus sp. NPDC055426 TaxID=3155536 RepID=UPI0034230F69